MGLKKQEKVFNIEKGSNNFMFQIKTIDKISENGLKLFDENHYNFSNDFNGINAIIVRSTPITEEFLSSDLLAIGRAGIGVNNIPVNYCTDKGIVVFNTPGANANGVKELVLAGMFLASRNIFKSIEFVKSLDLKNESLDHIIEKNKSQFKGFEIKGKKISVIGLGSIGIMVANDCVSLGLNVQGYDPYISVDKAWSLSRNVIPSLSLDKSLGESDFVTLHIPLTKNTKHFFDKSKINSLKKGCILLNFSRGEIIDEDAVLEALNNRQIFKYVTDFPNEKFLGNENVIAIPHLGASTYEAEENCSMMVVDQLKDFLENGCIKNSVNFPDCYMERRNDTDFRILISNQNIPNMIGQITTILANDSLNIINMVNKSKDNVAYSILDVSGTMTEDALKNIKSIPGVTMLRVI